MSDSQYGVKNTFYAPTHINPDGKFLCRLHLLPSFHSRPKIFFLLNSFLFICFKIVSNSKTWKACKQGKLGTMQLKSIKNPFLPPIFTYSISLLENYVRFIRRSVYLPWPTRKSFYLNFCCIIFCYETRQQLHDKNGTK